MSAPNELASRFRETLEPYVKSRDQVSYIRRVIALHLESSSPHGLIKRPLSLAEGDPTSINVSSVRGTHKEYLDALRANAEARQKFDEVTRTQIPESGTERPSTPIESSDFLTQRLTLLQLQRKRDRLVVIKDHVDRLTEDPAASDTFLDPSRIFRDASPLPEVPREIVSSMVAAQASEPQDLKTQAAVLEKIALRAKVLCRQEEQLLAQARRNAEGLPEVISNSAKMEALGATRNELINWIETELSSTAADGEEAQQDSTGDGSPGKHVDQAGIDTQLAQIKHKYDKYVASRKVLLEMLGRDSHQSATPSLKPQEADETTKTFGPAAEYLLTPYIERLLALSRSQKAMISQKTHVGNSLSKQAKDTCQSLVHLAEESQLLPTYPMKDSMRRRSGLQHELSGNGSGRPDLATRIKPWVFAADSAKIASLEAVTEDVERGQISLEATEQSLREIKKLLGLHEPTNAKVDLPVGDETEDDVWLAGEGQVKVTSGRKHTEKSSVKILGDPWSGLHGNLGLIGADDAG
ncbi:hypothetical protein LIA77_02776 [Sarocladium implicatum]|nr:hypothetical protein LIA77_02776 [Sarocladium implicatum]